jgi:hypothetical protein
MKHKHRWIVCGGLMIASLQLSACGPSSSATATQPQPAEVASVPGTNLNRVVLIPEAAKRLDIQIAEVRNEIVTRKRSVGGEVVPATGAAAGTGKLWIRVPLSEGDLAKVSGSEPAMVLPLVRTADTTGSTAKRVDAPAGAGVDETSPVLHYEVDNGADSLTVGQRVRIELSLGETGVQRKVVPYSSVIYDLNGETWVYTNPEPLAFVRERITVDYIDGDKAFLSEGPAAGTKIASVGVAELYGTEFGVGH